MFVGILRVGADCACGLLFYAASLSGAFPPNIPAGLWARLSRLGGFTRPFSGYFLFPPAGGKAFCHRGRSGISRILFSLAPHTSGPRDVPRCGALSLLQKDAALQEGDPAETAARLHVKLRDLVTD
jgi:hypothetical protein